MSMPTPFGPLNTASETLTPEPQKGSRTISPSLVLG
mgnify:FL=1